MRLRKKLSTKQFILSHLFLLTLGLIILGGLYYILNIQYQKSNQPFLNGPVTTLPRTLTLDLDQPGDDILSFEPQIIVSGTTSPVKEVLIYTDSQNLVIKSKTDGSFSQVLDLDEGVNKINVVVFDSNGDSRSASRTIYYSTEKL